MKGLEPSNLLLGKQALYQLSYIRRLEIIGHQGVMLSEVFVGISVSLMLSLPPTPKPVASRMACQGAR
jgi:hypothetical protein